MSATLEALEILVRRGLAILLIPIALLLALGLLGIGNATTDASPFALYAGAALGLSCFALCIIVAFRTERVWLAWLMLSVGYLPLVLMAF